MNVCLYEIIIFPIRHTYHTYAEYEIYNVYKGSLHISYVQKHLIYFSLILSYFRFSTKIIHHKKVNFILDGSCIEHQKEVSQMNLNSLGDTTRNGIDVSMLSTI